MKRYETLYILKASTSEKEMKELEDRFVHLAKQHKGEIVHKQNLGKRTLAYPIKKEREGIVVHINFVGDSKVISEMEKILRYDERVIRFMTTVVPESSHANA